MTCPRRIISALAAALALATAIAACSSDSTSAAVTVDEGCAVVRSQTHEDTGFETCKDGSTRRLQALACPTAPASATMACSAGHEPACKSDADCPGPLGYCADSRHLIGYCGCFNGCVQDSDCGPGFVCDCGSVTGTCTRATCTDNASCGPGGACIRSESSDTCTRSYDCATSADACRGDADCEGSSGDCLLQGTRHVCSDACLMPP